MCHRWLACQDHRCTCESDRSPSSAVYVSQPKRPNVGPIGSIRWPVCFDDCSLRPPLASPLRRRGGLTPRANRSMRLMGKTSLPRASSIGGLLASASCCSSRWGWCSDRRPVTDSSTTMTMSTCVKTPTLPAVSLSRASCGCLPTAMPRIGIQRPGSPTCWIASCTASRPGGII